jgi:hypothetical protein
MIVNDFCLSSAQLCYVIINVWNLESYMHISNRCVLWKIASGAENLILQLTCLKVKVKVILQLTVSQPDRLGVRHPSGTGDQFLFR